jgi:hypothetical protein
MQCVLRMHAPCCQGGPHCGGQPAAQANNQLNGTLPASYSNLVSLTALRLGSNNIGGAARAARLLLTSAVCVTVM